jgi:hypothetical protein
LFGFLTLTFDLALSFALVMYFFYYKEVDFYILYVNRLRGAVVRAEALGSGDPCVPGSKFESHCWVWVPGLQIRPYKPRPRVTVGVCTKRTFNAKSLEY